MMLQLFDLAVCAFEFYINYHLLNHFLRKKERGRAEVIFTLLGMTVVLYLVNATFKIAWINSVTTITLVTLMAMILLRGSFFKTLFLVSCPLHQRANGTADRICCIQCFGGRLCAAYGDD